MALVKFGGGVASISGKIDGTVYARNRAGAIARGWTKPNNPQSERQTQVRQLFSTVATMWSDLTVGEQQDWNGLAATVTRINRQGDSYVPTGRQIFLETQVALGSNGFTFLTAAPADLNPAAMGEGLPNAVAEAAAGVLDEFGLTSIPSGTWDQMLVDATPPLTVSKTNVKNLFRRIGAYSNAATADLKDGYVAVFGDAAVIGQTIGIRLRFLKEANGIVTTPTDLFATVVAGD